MPLFLILLLSSAFLNEASADVGQDSVVSRAEYTKNRLEDEGGGHSFAPVVGYEPVFKFVFGAAYFFDDPQVSFGVDVNTNFDRVHQVHYTAIHRFSSRWEYGVRGGVTKGFDSYYGEGGETRDQDFTRLWGIYSTNRAHIAYKPTKVWSIGLYADARFRTEVPGSGPGAPASGRIAPDEQTAAIGLFQKVDRRDSKNQPRQGFVFGTTVSIVPQSFSSVPGQTTFGQVEADFIVYEEILEGFIPDVIAAFQVMGGFTIGDSSYLYDYRLGGADRMRGYNENRFRGKTYYMQQTELRFPIYSLFSGAAFLGFGDASDGLFTNPKLTYGLGLRVGLPPDFVSRIRIDFGAGRDSSGIYADFGQTF